MFLYGQNMNDRMNLDMRMTAEGYYADSTVQCFCYSEIYMINMDVGLFSIVV